jgi:hypothetical protein
MKYVLFTLLSSLLIFISCKKDRCDHHFDSMKINMGTTCGWCAGHDTLNINSKTTKYRFDDPCDDNNDFTKSNLTDPNKWNGILLKFNSDKFNVVDLNTCHVCADGCDTWIQVKMKNGDEHTIRFGYPELIEMDPELREFVELMDSIRLGLKN